MQGWIQLGSKGLGRALARPAFTPERTRARGAALARRAERRKRCRWCSRSGWRSPANAAGPELAAAMRGARCRSRTSAALACRAPSRIVGPSQNGLSCATSRHVSATRPARGGAPYGKDTGKRPPHCSAWPPSRPTQRRSAFSRIQAGEAPMKTQAVDVLDTLERVRTALEHNEPHGSVTFQVSSVAPSQLRTSVIDTVRNRRLSQRSRSGCPSSGWICPMAT